MTRHNTPATPQDPTANGKLTDPPGRKPRALCRRSLALSSKVMRPDTPARARLSRVFHDTLSSYLRELSPHSRRFWILVPLTGLLSGIGAVAAVHFMRVVQALGWGQSGSLLDVTSAAPIWRRVGVPLIAGVLIVAVSTDSTRKDRARPKWWKPSGPARAASGCAPRSPAAS
jgi:hypothetical protein